MGGAAAVSSGIGDAGVDVTVPFASAETTLAGTPTLQLRWHPAPW